MKKRLRCASLFAGAGGLDLGLEGAGIEIVVSVEWDPHAAETLRLNGRTVVEGDINSLIKHDPKCTFLGDAKLDMIAGGPPCQAYSHAGKRKGLKDPRGTLYRAFVKTLKARKPRYFLYENVPSLLDKNLRDAFDKILRDLQKAGYSATWGVVNAADYGAPQIRERLIILGSRKRVAPPFPVPTHAGKWVTFGEAVQGLRDTGEGTKFCERIMRCISHIPEGGNWRDLPTEELRHLAIGNAKNGGLTGVCRRLSFSRPAPTVTASGPTANTTLLAHPIESRPLTVLEYSRIQGFPDTYRFCGPTREKYRQIGNAVPIALGKALGTVLSAKG